MRLDQIKQQETEKRRGATWKTIIMVIWLAIGFVVAYFATEWIFDIRIITPAMFYGIGLPDVIPEWVIQVIMMLFIVTILQVIFFIGYGMASPGGRRRSGVPSMHSYNKVLDDDSYNR